MIILQSLSNIVYHLNKHYTQESDVQEFDMPLQEWLPFLSDSEQMLSEALHRFSQEEIAPLANEIDASNKFPRHLWPKLGQIGCLGITVPTADGGAGMGYLSHVIAMSAISSASAAVGLSYAAHSNLCVNQLSRFSNAKQKKHYLPRLISGEHVGALAISEVNAGSDCLNMQLKATASEGGYVLNGHKMWTTNGPDADVIIVYARTANHKKNNSFTAFILDREIPGWQSMQKINKLGMRGSNTSELVFKECFVSKEQILGQVGQGCEILMSGLDYERIILAGGPIGIMEACLAAVGPYMHERQQFGQPIGSFQLMQAKLADMYTRYQAAKAYVYSTAMACDQGHITQEDAASCILFASEHATQIALDAIQAFGGNGYSTEYPVERYLRDAKLYEIGAGTSEIRRTLIGRALLKRTVLP